MSEEFSGEPTKPISSVENVAFWTKHYTQWRQASVSRAAYCRAHHLHYDRFHYWCRKQNSSGKKKKKPIVKALIPITVSEKENSVHLPTLLCCIELKQGHCIRFYHQETLLTVLNRLV